MKLTKVFVFPLPPNIGNKRYGSWWMAHKDKMAWLEQCDALVVNGVLPKPPRKPWPKVRVSATMVVGGAMDDENAMMRSSKYPLDWLKTRGYIPDDRKTNVQWAGLPTQRVTRKEAYTLTLTLEKT